MKTKLDYRETTFREIYNKLSSENQKIVNNFIKYCEITAGNNSIKKIFGQIVIVADVFDKHLSSLNLDDIREFLALLNQSLFAPSTKNGIRKILRRFLKWEYKNWNTKFNGLKDIKLTLNDERKLTKSDLLTLQEMEMIIKSIDSLKYKTLILLFQETAARPEELLNLKWKNIDLDKKEVLLNSSKTGRARSIPINRSIEHLKRYRVEAFCEPPRNDDFVFQGNKQGYSMKIQNLSAFLKELEKRLKFPKHLYPYLWRHSILTNMIKKLSPKQYEMFAGHSLEIGMKVYAHLDISDLKEELFTKIYDIQELKPEEKDELKQLRKEFEYIKKKLKLVSDFFTEQAKIYKKPENKITTAEEISNAKLFLDKLKELE